MKLTFEDGSKSCTVSIKESFGSVVIEAQEPTRTGASKVDMVLSPAEARTLCKAIEETAKTC